MQEKKIAIYARKSKVTNSGNSIDQQIAACKRYAQAKFGALEEEFLVYADEGLSGFYSDRPQYQKMLDEIRSGTIKTLICYKIDRISRKTTELLNFIEELKAAGVAFVACSDEIDTESKTGKMMLSLLASIAEFERDIIAERISDNMLELAKEGHWLGGNCPTGYCVQKETVMQRGKKVVVHYLEPDEDTASLVQAIFETFLTKCSLSQTVEYLNQKGYRTVNNKPFERHSVKNILQNPVYAKAEPLVYTYLQAHSTPIFANKEAFDGQHGLMAYNKTCQEKIKNKERSTYLQRLSKRPAEVWVVALGRHPGLIGGGDWVTAQEILAQNQSRYCRSHKKNKACFPGKIICPDCGSPLYVRLQSGRCFQDKSPFFYYVCSAKHKDRRLCAQSPNIQGNGFDVWLAGRILHSEWIKTVYKDVVMRFIAQKGIEEGNGTLNRIDKRINQLKKTIGMQVVNLRNAPDEVKGFIYEDLRQLKVSLRKLEEEKKVQTPDLMRQGTDKCNLDQLLNRFTDINELLDSSSIEKKRLIFKQFINRVELSDKFVRVYLE